MGGERFFARPLCDEMAPGEGRWPQDVSARRPIRLRHNCGPFASRLRFEAGRTQQPLGVGNRPRIVAPSKAGAPQRSPCVRLTIVRSPRGCKTRRQHEDRQYLPHRHRRSRQMPGDGSMASISAALLRLPGLPSARPRANGPSVCSPLAFLSPRIIGRSSMAPHRRITPRPCQALPYSRAERPSKSGLSRAMPRAIN